MGLHQGCHTGRQAQEGPVLKDFMLPGRGLEMLNNFTFEFVFCK